MIKDQFLKRGYEKTVVENQVKKVKKWDKSFHYAEQNKR